MHESDVTFLISIYVIPSVVSRWIIDIGQTGNFYIGHLGESNIVTDTRPAIYQLVWNS